MHNVRQYPVKDCVYGVLSATATGVVMGLIANAILGNAFKHLGTQIDVFMTLYQVVVSMQFLTSVLIGVLVGIQFKMNGVEIVCVASATFVGSGAYEFTEDGVRLLGIGNLINIMITSLISVLCIFFFRNKFGSLDIILMPITIGIGCGFIGLLFLPYVSGVTKILGNMIHGFTSFQPLLMSIFIATSFSILVITPISTVAIGIAIGLSGLSSAAASVGVAACTAVLFWGSLRVNNKGVTLAILFGAMKLMIPNLIKYPSMLIPVMINAIFSGIGIWLFKLSGTPQSAGFGIVGLVGPIEAFILSDSHNFFNRLSIVAISFIVIPFLGACIIEYVCFKVLKIYDSTIFEYTEIAK